MCQKLKIPRTDYGVGEYEAEPLDIRQNSQLVKDISDIFFFWQNCIMILLQTLLGN